ncbi:hypothetical protein Tsubulata_044706 [Turnera subulata]|uniref:Uncharacterized protein n=1 Tax=Turnera subulata TaxID=218843 RepID=A0A9Q0FP58_9ROSI|nr:hypothetical protein Tsubulata_044706 [Turnera subulata]
MYQTILNYLFPQSQNIQEHIESNQDQSPEQVITPNLLPKYIQDVKQIDVPELHLSISISSFSSALGLQEDSTINSIASVGSASTSHPLLRPPNPSSSAAVSFPSSTEDLPKAVSLVFLRHQNTTNHEDEISSTTSSSAPDNIIAAASIMTPTRNHAHHDDDDPNQNHPPHPIIQTLREQELGRHVLVLAVPMTIGLFSVYNPVNAAFASRLTAIALSIGFAGIFNGILLRRTCHRASNVMELLGISLVLLAFFGFISLFVPDNLTWIPSLCWVSSLILFVVALCFRRSGTSTHHREHPEHPSIQV